MGIWDKIKSAGNAVGKSVCDFGKEMYDAGCDAGKEMYDVGCKVGKGIYDVGCEMYDAGCEAGRQIYDDGCKVGKWIYDAGCATVDWVEEKTQDAVTSIMFPELRFSDWTNNGKETVGRSVPIRRNPAVADTMNTSQMLHNLQNELRVQANAIEAKAMDVVDGSFEKMFEMQGANPEIQRRLNHDLRQVRRENKGMIDNYISTRISTDNPECRRILEMPPGEQKEREWEKFSSELIEEIKKCQCQNINNFVTREWASVDEVISDQNYINEKRIESQRRDLDSLIQDMTKGSSAKEEHIANACYRIAVCDYVNEVIETA